MPNVIFITTEPIRHDNVRRTATRSWARPTATAWSPPASASIAATVTAELPPSGESW